MEYRNILLEAGGLAKAKHLEVLARGNIGVNGKYDNTDIATAADIETEVLLRDYFNRILPDYNIFGEEFGAHYNGNGKVIILDPLDCTRNYAARRGGFGTIIGIYENNELVAGLKQDTLTEITHILTIDGLERLGPKNESKENVIFLEQKLPEHETPEDGLAWREELSWDIQERFPGSRVIVDQQDFLARTRVYEGLWTGYFHTGLAVHDISTEPLFSRFSDAKAVDHRRRPYRGFDMDLECQKYNHGAREVLYSHPLLVGGDDFIDGMTDILSRYEKSLDMKQNPVF
ncbi:MAG: inositol monophosphatase family protein [Candidatus Woesearchaeota archaeon]|jgi:hypothetical protein|nr:inositol monophosphatase family protein [Candidatus Woesearchaeota archaeon]MDP7458182.1 inositol monophosphatase family protein [Candidatus Woesearchaeota archaeon]|tara:strand:+ start:214 stop:1077 length:864 start_codon:yes stop_codon:yes gene_type:complete